MSQLVYAASMLTVSESVFKTVQENLFAFLGKNRKDKIKRMVMHQPVAKGGINFTWSLNHYAWLRLEDY